MLTRGSAITGTILDEYGEPLEGASVTVLLRRFGPGRLMVLPIRVERRTDDRGRYRLFGLMPGSYFLAVSADGVLAGSAGYRVNGYAPVYYPRATDIREAVPLEVSADGDLSDMDVVFTPSPVAPVTGVVLDAGGNPVRQGSVLISPSHRSGAVATLPRTAAVRIDGGFTIANVAPGDYVVQAFVAATPERPEEFGAQFVTVTDVPPPGIVVRTTLGSTVSGRVVVEADSDKPAPDGAFSLMPIPADFDYAPVFGRGASLPLTVDRTFRMSGLTGPTRFVLSSAGSWFVKSVILAGRLKPAPTPE